MKDKLFIILAADTTPYDSKGWGFGYVALPQGHPWYGLRTDDIPCSVHGNLSYSELIDEHWVIGFDTLHLNDTIEKWPMSAVLKEARNLLKQAQDVC